MLYRTDDDIYHSAKYLTISGPKGEYKISSNLHGLKVDHYGRKVYSYDQAAPSEYYITTEAMQTKMIKVDQNQVDSTEVLSSSQKIRVYPLHEYKTPAATISMASDGLVICSESQEYHNGVETSYLTTCNLSASYTFRGQDEIVIPMGKLWLGCWVRTEQLGTVWVYPGMGPEEHPYLLSNGPLTIGLSYGFLGNTSDMMEVIQRSKVIHMMLKSQAQADDSLFLTHHPVLQGHYSTASDYACIHAYRGIITNLDRIPDTGLEHQLCEVAK